MRKIRTRMDRLDVDRDDYISHQAYGMMANNIVKNSKLTQEQEEATRAAILRLADQVGIKSEVMSLSRDEAAKLESKTLLSMSVEERK